MKPIAKLLVPLTGSDRDAASLGTAFGLAEMFGAHVESLFAYPDPRSFPVAGVPFSLGVMEAMMNGQDAYAREAEKAAREFLAKASTRHRATPQDGMPATNSFIAELGAPPEVIARKSRLSDVVVFPSIRLPGFIEIIEAFVSVLTKVQRPVVMSLENPSDKPIRSVAIAWNGSKSAGRAVMAATPILKRAEKISVLEIAESHSRSQVDGVIQYLALQGIKASRRSARRGLGSVGDSLAEGAHDSGADMLVMGGYGHSYFREALLGGVTADVLARATVPVFLAH